MILYCLRHGQAEHNLNQIMNGSPLKPYSLTNFGRQQAQQSAEILKNIKFDLIVTSEFLRCKETVEIINKSKKLSLKIDPRINDLISGVEGESYHKYIEERERAAEKQGTDIYNVKINDGESIEELKKRVFDFLDELKSQSHETVLIVTHYDILQAINAYSKNLENKGMKEFITKHCEIYRFEI